MFFVKKFETFELKFLKDFSALSFLITIISIPKLILKQKLSFETADWFFPISAFPPKSAMDFWMYFGAALLIWLIVYFFSTTTRMSIFNSAALVVAWLLSLSLEFFDGKVYHEKHAYFFVALGFCIFRRQQNIQLVFSALVAGLTYCYSASGLWKLRMLFINSDWWLEAKTNLAYHVAYSIGRGTTENWVLINFLNSNQQLAGAIWLLVIAIQIFLPILAIIYAPKKPWILLGFVFFHISTYAVLGILFLPQILLITWMIYFLYAMKRAYK